VQNQTMANKLPVKLVLLSLHRNCFNKQDGSFLFNAPFKVRLQTRYSVANVSYKQQMSTTHCRHTLMLQKKNLLLCIVTTHTLSNC